MKMIVIVDQDYGVSKNGEIPWSFQQDLISFKKNTQNSTVIMGKNTFFTLKAPLSNRINCVISSSLQQANGFLLFNTLEECYKTYRDHNTWLIGGAALYNYALRMNYIDFILMTRVHESYNADTFLNTDLLTKFQKHQIFESSKYSIYTYTL